jgi:hypothetical protein
MKTVIFKWKKIIPQMPFERGVHYRKVSEKVAFTQQPQALNA